MIYESWRISYQSSEQAARAAFNEIATLRAKLAASEARAERYRAGMREMIDCRTCRNHTRDGCIQTALCVDADGYRRALPVRFWVATSSAALAEWEVKQ